MALQLKRSKCPSNFLLLKGFHFSRVNYFQELFNHKRNDQLFIYFDEIQYLKNWEVHLKSLVDSYPDYKFVATGSAAAALRLKSMESGAGRFSNFILPPLTFAVAISFCGQVYLCNCL